MIKVGFNKAEYKDVKFDVDGWACAKQYMPLDFDLCHLKLKDRVRAGWASGNAWEGLKLKASDEVLQWKRNTD